jgi:hypothetical protein
MGSIVRHVLLVFFYKKKKKLSVQQIDIENVGKKTIYVFNNYLHYELKRRAIERNLKPFTLSRCRLLCLLNGRFPRMTN